MYFVVYIRMYMYYGIFDQVNNDLDGQIGSKNRKNRALAK